LIENLQRQGLADMDKADAIVRLWELKSCTSFAHEGSQGKKHDPAIDQISQRLGYSTDAILAFMRMVRMEEKTKEAVRKAKTGRSVVSTAQARPAQRRARALTWRGRRFRTSQQSRKEMGQPASGCANQAAASARMAGLGEPRSWRSPARILAIKARQPCSRSERPQATISLEFAHGPLLILTRRA
jgi:hypothetical protein